MTESFNLDAIRDAWYTKERKKRDAVLARRSALMQEYGDGPVDTSALPPMPPYRSVREVWTDYLIIESEGQYFKVSFTMDKQGQPKFGSEKRVKQTYVELSDTERRVYDLVSSRVYPGLERKPGGPDNWVEATGGLPPYIERIAKHLHYERGYTISRAIATAVNTVKRWARKGTVTKGGTKKLVTAKTQAQAAAAVAQWEAKKAAARSTKLAMEAREEQLLDLAKQVASKKAAKWGHGFVPKNEAARQLKAKGSPVARKRVGRLYGPGTKEFREAHIDRRRKEPGTKIRATGGGQERVSRIEQARHADIKDATTQQRVNLQGKEHSKGGGQTQRALKSWDKIAEDQKVVRNGKRYVLTTFGGKQQLTEWQGENSSQAAPDPNKRVLRSIREADARKLTTAQIRRLLKVPGQPASVRKVLNRILNEKVEKGKKSA